MTPSKDFADQENAEHLAHEPAEDETVFVCNMAALGPAQRQAHIANTAQLLAAAQSVTEQPNGYTLEFALDNMGNLNEDSWQQAARFIALERLCCPFFGFTLELAPGATSFRLGLTGPAGVKPFIQAELGLKLTLESTLESIVI